MRLRSRVPNEISRKTSVPRKIRYPKPMCSPNESSNEFSSTVPFDTLSAVSNAP